MVAACGIALTMDWETPLWTVFMVAFISLAIVGQCLDKAGGGGWFSRQDGENFYSLLGAYRGLPEARVEDAGSAGMIDWPPWHEERF